MTAYAYADVPQARRSWFARAESWLDERGRPAWLVAMVIGFVAFWPLGLAVLGYMAMTGRFAGTGRSGRRRAAAMAAMMPSRSTGNAAFDAYRADTLRRLEDEREAFEAFLGRLREAKDKAEFDQFMADRAETSDRAEDEPAKA